MGFQTAFSNNFIAILCRGVRYDGLIVHFRGFCTEALFHHWIISSCTEPQAKMFLDCQLSNDRHSEADKLYKNEPPDKLSPPITCFLFPRKNHVNGKLCKHNYTINFYSK